MAVGALLEVALVDRLHHLIHPIVGLLVVENFYYFCFHILSIFQGETEPKDYYDWNTYKWCNGSKDTMTKYCSNSSFGIVDNKTELDPEDDAAYVNWGPSWRMPTHEQLQELAENCTWECSGASCKFTGPNGNTLYLPGAGYYYYDLFSGEGDGGIYWSRTIDPEYNNAFYLNFYMYGVSYDFTCRRMDGFTVRAVRVSQN